MTDIINCNLDNLIGRYFQHLDKAIQKYLIIKSSALVKNYNDTKFHYNSTFIDIVCTSMAKSYLNCLHFLNTNLPPTNNNTLYNNMFVSSVVCSPSYRFNDVVLPVNIITDVRLSVEHLLDIWKYFRTHHPVGLSLPYKLDSIKSNEDPLKYLTTYNLLLEFFVTFFSMRSGFLKITVADGTLGIFKRITHELFLKSGETLSHGSNIGVCCFSYESTL